MSCDVTGDRWTTADLTRRISPLSPRITPGSNLLVVMDREPPEYKAAYLHVLGGSELARHSIALSPVPGRTILSTAPHFNRNKTTKGVSCSD